MIDSVAKKAKLLLTKVNVRNIDHAINDLPNNYIEVIICNDVIEQMKEPDDFLKKIKNKIVNDGKMIGSIPKVKCISDALSLLLQKDWEYRDSSILNKTYLRFFQKSIIRILNNSHHNLIKIEGFNDKLNYYSIGTLTAYLMKTQLSVMFGLDTIYTKFRFIALKK